MRDLERQYRITARSIPEVVGEMESVLSRYGMTRAVTFRGRKLSNEAFINAAILHLLGLDQAEQSRALSAALERLESILGSEGVSEALADPVPAPPRTPTLGHSVDPKTGRRSDDRPRKGKTG